MTKRAKVPAARAIGVKQLATDQLKPNPHNPRILFDKAPLKTLEESIAKVRILVPLTVYMRKSDGQYFILDGQRRWICAKNLGLPTVPVNQVDEPNLIQNIVTMFQIHKLREDWELMPTALKLEVLIIKLEERSAPKLAELTGLDVAVVTRCKKLLSFPKKYKDLMLDPDPQKRVPADFFIELYPFLTDRVVKKISPYSRDTLTRKMLVKYQQPNGGIKAVTDFRKVKQHIVNARKADKVSALTRRLAEFVDNVELLPDHLLIRAADVTAKAMSLLKNVKDVEEALADLDVDVYIGEETLWRAVEKLLHTTRRCLLKVGRRVRE